MLIPPTDTIVFGLNGVSLGQAVPVVKVETCAFCGGQCAFQSATWMPSYLFFQVFTLFILGFLFMYSFSIISVQNVADELIFILYIPICCTVCKKRKIRYFVKQLLN